MWWCFFFLLAIREIQFSHGWRMMKARHHRVSSPAFHPSSPLSSPLLLASQSRSRRYHYSMTTTTTRLYVLKREKMMNIASHVDFHLLPRLLMMRGHDDDKRKEKMLMLRRSSSNSDGLKDIFMSDDDDNDEEEDQENGFLPGANIFSFTAATNHTSNTPTHNVKRVATIMQTNILKTAIKDIQLRIQQSQYNQNPALVLESVKGLAELLSSSLQMIYDIHDIADIIGLFRHLSFEQSSTKELMNAVISHLENISPKYFFQLSIQHVMQSILSYNKNDPLIKRFIQVVVEKYADKRLVLNGGPFISTCRALGYFHPDSLEGKILLNSLTQKLKIVQSKMDAVDLIFCIGIGSFKLWLKKHPDVISFINGLLNMTTIPVESAFSSQNFNKLKVNDIIAACRTMSLLDGREESTKQLVSILTYAIEQSNLSFRDKVGCMIHALRNLDGHDSSTKAFVKAILPKVKDSTYVWSGKDVFMAGESLKNIDGSDPSTIELVKIIAENMEKYLSHSTGTTNIILALSNLIGSLSNLDGNHPSTKRLVSSLARFIQHVPLEQVTTISPKAFQHIWLGISALDGADPSTEALLGELVKRLEYLHVTKPLLMYPVDMCRFGHVLVRLNGESPVVQRLVHVVASIMDHSIDALGNMDSSTRLMLRYGYIKSLHAVSTMNGLKSLLSNELSTKAFVQVITKLIRCTMSFYSNTRDETYLITSSLDLVRCIRVLCNLNSDSSSTHALIDALSEWIELSLSFMDHGVSDNHLGNIFYGIKGLDFNEPSTQRLIAVLTQHIEQRYLIDEKDPQRFIRSNPPQLSKRDIVMSCYALQFMDSKHSMVRQLVEILATLIDESTLSATGFSADDIHFITEGVKALCRDDAETKHLSRALTKFIKQEFLETPPVEDIL